jgi:hypothetical protein
MAVVMPPGRPYVLPAALWPTYAAHANDAADLYAQAGTGCAQEADDSRATAARLGMLTEGLFSEAMQTAHQRLGVAHDDHKEICGHLKNAASETADILDAYAGRLDRIDEAAHQEISASPPEARDGIIAAAQAAAVSAHDIAAADIGRLHGRVAAKVTPLVAGIGAPAPAAPAPPDTQAPGGSAGDPAPRRDSASAAVPAPRSRHSGDLAARGDADNAGDSGASGNNGDLATRHDPSPPLPPLPVSPLGGFGGGGSAGSGSGLGGGGLGSGLGSGPLSSLVGGVGPSPAASGLGSGVANPMSNAAALTNPGAFGQGLSAGTAAGSAVSPVGAVPSPSTATPSNVPGPARGGAVPAVAGGSSPTGSLPAAGASGAHAAPAVSPPPSVPTAVPAAMLPSTGMGAPGPGGGAAAGAPVESATTSPAGSGSGGAGAPAAGGGARGAGAGAALVPAAVVNPVPEVPRALRGLSDDAQWAALLAWELRHDCIELGFPVDWAVGVFRREGGMDKVVISNEGSGYVPRGVFLPRETRLLVTDPLVDTDFRDTWFGCPDPARVLVEYSKLRVEGGWALEAAATTGPVDHLRIAGVEHPDRLVLTGGQRDFPD